MLYNLLLYMGFQLSELQYPVDITACRISFTFSKLLWMTPTEYQERSAQELPNCGPAASMAAQGIFYGTDRSAEGIRL